MLRNCLIILLTNKEKLPVGNIAESLNVTPTVVKNVLRVQDQFHLDGAPYRNFVKKSYGDKRLCTILERILSSQETGYTIKSIQEVLISKYSYTIPYSKIKRLLRHNLGYSWKKISPQQPYVNTPRNVHSRQVFAKRIITAIDNGKVIVNIDETGFANTYP